MGNWTLDHLLDIWSLLFHMQPVQDFKRYALVIELLFKNLFKIQILGSVNFLHDEDFTEGYITNTKYDNSDFEWLTFNPFTNKTYITFVTLHIIGTQILKKHPKVRIVFDTDSKMQFMYMYLF